MNLCGSFWTIFIIFCNFMCLFWQFLNTFVWLLRDLKTIWHRYRFFLQFRRFFFTIAIFLIKLLFSLPFLLSKQRFLELFILLRIFFVFVDRFIVCTQTQTPKTKDFKATHFANIILWLYKGFFSSFWDWCWPLMIIYHFSSLRLLICFIMFLLNHSWHQRVFSSPLALPLGSNIFLKLVVLVFCGRYLLVYNFFLLRKLIMFWRLRSLAVFLFEDLVLFHFREVEREGNKKSNSYYYW